MGEFTEIFAKIGINDTHGFPLFHWSSSVVKEGYLMVKHDFPFVNPLFCT